jgi:hypothetical protein
MFDQLEAFKNIQFISGINVSALYEGVFSAYLEL